MGISLPPFSELRVNYPVIEHQALLSSIGGGVNSVLMDNGCVIRMSKAFNYLGDPAIPFDQWPTPSWKVIPKSINFDELRKAKIQRDNLHSIPRTYKYVNAFETTYGADKKRYCFRVNEFFDYMNHKYKQPDHKILLEPRQTMLTVGQISQLKRTIYGKTGIICFKAKFGADRPGSAASGHFTLWDGNVCLYGDYFQDTRTYAIYFWTC